MVTRDPRSGDPRRSDGGTAVVSSGTAVPERRVRRQPETKAFLATSEFWVTVVAIVGLFVAAYALDDLGDPDAWRWSALVAISYIVSRGIAKSATQRNWRREVFDGQ